MKRFRAFKPEQLVRRAVLEAVGIPVGLGFALVTGYLLRRDRLLVGAIELGPRAEASPAPIEREARRVLAPVRATRPRTAGSQRSA